MNTIVQIYLCKDDLFSFFIIYVNFLMLHYKSYSGYSCCDLMHLQHNTPLLYKFTDVAPIHKQN